MNQTPVVVEPVEQFSRYHTGTIDKKDRLSIPAPYRDVIIARNAVNIVHGLLDGNFVLSEDGISYQDGLVFKFKRPLEAKEVKTKPRDIAALLDPVGIDDDLCIGVTSDDEVRAYTESDWAKITNKGSCFKFFGKYEIDDAGRITLDTYLKQRFRRGEQVGMWGMGEYFIIKDPISNGRS